jgi:protein-S-isoprenylcysteine O-methyltransferase Ste14
MLWWAAGLLSLERLFYIWLCESPQSFVALCRHPRTGAPVDPVDVVAAAFAIFKTIQIAVFAWWCLWLGEGRLFPLAAGPLAIASGTMLIVAGQALVMIGFRRLGRTAVFYGQQFGREVQWESGFPFSWTRHPQYVGAVATMWGVMLIFRYPAPDWWWLPLLGTVYYAAGAQMERYDHAPVATPVAQSAPK